MLGAIIGDIVGSRFEFTGHKGAKFELFTPECRMTDDSIMTLAVADAIMSAQEHCEYDLVSAQNEAYCRLLAERAVTSMRRLGRRYPDAGYGGRFAVWLRSNEPAPYGSFGNGAGMRISPVGFAARTAAEAADMADAVTCVTHDHPEAMLAAEVLAASIFLLRCGRPKEAVRELAEKMGYDLGFTCASIMDDYAFDVTCRGSVPQAIVAFLESDSFEDAIRRAVSIGGDTDTIAAMTGGLAEAFYGVPDAIAEAAFGYFDDAGYAIYQRWLDFVAKDRAGRERYEFSFAADGGTRRLFFTREGNGWSVSPSDKTTDGAPILDPERFGEAARGIDALFDSPDPAGVRCAFRVTPGRSPASCATVAPDALAPFIELWEKANACVKPAPLPGEEPTGDGYDCCGVFVYDKGTSLTYLCDIDGVSVGDDVLVPLGEDNAEFVARVDSVSRLTREELPVPPERMKYVIAGLK